MTVGGVSHERQQELDAARVQLRKLWAEDVPQREIARRLGIAKSTVERWMAQEGLKRGGWRGKEKERVRAQVLQRQGKSWRKIAEELDVSMDSVGRWLSSRRGRRGQPSDRSVHVCVRNETHPRGFAEDLRLEDCVKSWGYA